MSDDPSKTLPAVDAMRQDWAIVDALMGGTKAMRSWFSSCSRSRELPCRLSL